ncbi:DUF6223 family protein [Actinomadura coerulea]|uniref:DUF6223 family protein n=1 Tax=Actinomadura coerulea TaxID=46159 RepID=UPI00341BB814
MAQATDLDAHSLTAGRLWAGSAALLGLVGAVIGGLALARSVRRAGNGGRTRTNAALLAGLISVVTGALSLAVAWG